MTEELDALHDRVLTAGATALPTYAQLVEEMRRFPGAPGVAALLSRIPGRDGRVMEASVYRVRRGPSGISTTIETLRPIRIAIVTGPRRWSRLDAEFQDPRGRLPDVPAVGARPTDHYALTHPHRHKYR